MINLTDEQEKIAQQLFDVRHSYWNSQLWDYTEWEELDYEIRQHLKLPSEGLLNWSPK